MSEVTVAEYAEILKISPKLLLQQLESAGIHCAEGLKHRVTDEQKQKLLEKLKSDHGEKDSVTGGGVTQFTVTRERVSELNVKVPGTSSKKTVKVVTKKTRKFIKRPATPEGQDVVAAPEPETQEAVAEVVEQAVPQVVVEEAAPALVAETPAPEIVSESAPVVAAAPVEEFAEEKAV
ncbi:MAG TPA: translation initiation factor IF-2 N-terminal domain-containing protein, partial [Candidatus Berkiella sp.]|nr:translation initiation factor IF-2 N-terminal domain-containing protein [Candidatus Berkiella sp.]